MGEYCIENDGARRAELAAIHRAQNEAEYADRIAALEAEVARLRDALEEIRDEHCMDPEGNSQIARAALTQQTPPT